MGFLESPEMKELLSLDLNSLFFEKSMSRALPL